MSELTGALVEAGLLPLIYRAVEPAYPEEGCGFVFEDPESGLEVLPTANRAQRLHEIDPKRYPRGARDWFEPDMKPWLRAERAGKAPRVIFHSHPDVGAYFSDGDFESAIVRDDANAVQERNPGVLHLVVSVRAGAADGARLFAFDPAAATFTCVAEFDASGTPVESSGP